MSEEKIASNGLSEELSGYLAARSRYERERRQYTPPDNIPANKEAIIGHLNTQIRSLAALARKYGALRSLIEKIPNDENDPMWELLKNTVVHGTIVEARDDPEGGPEQIWTFR